MKTDDRNTLFSLHWELKTLLYLGVVLLSGGLGILVYKNIDTIGHQTILLFLFGVCIGSFFYCFRKSPPFSVLKTASPNIFFDYILLLACLSFVTCIGYLQFEYSFFGTSYGLATFIPMLVLFASAYYFDHLGILSLAITNLAAWLGISITPLKILQENDFGANRLIYTGMGLGILLNVLAFLSKRQNIKRHFAFTYTNFGLHLLFIAGLAGLFKQEGPVDGLWFLLMAGIIAYFYMLGLRQSSFYIIVVTVLYGYIVLGYVVLMALIQMVDSSAGIGAIYLGIIYFILSAIGLIRLLIFLNRQIKSHDSL